ncbi:MAG TPA: hypothetical protein DFR83_06015, partial [Deltaproteobacteria bacterium]|nr:hypothetical protein [Deltaproteobacteria bacterium]
MYRWIVLAGLLCACSNDADPSSKGGDGEPESDISEARDSAADTGTSGADDDELRVAATVRLLDPYGPRLSGVSVSDVDSEARCTTDDRGECVVDVHRDADFQLSVVEESVLE